MDFFSAVADPSQPILHNDRQSDNANDSFAEAIACRFGSTALLTTRLTPVALAPPPLRLPSSPMASMSLAAPSPPRSATHPVSHAQPPVLPSQFTTVTTAAIGTWIGDHTALILDIRPHAAYSNARVPRAVSLSVPSTLLKRPLFSLHRLADMLPSANARARFSAWRSASHILVYDADSATILESSNIYGLLRKFKNDGFQGELAWLKGGFQAVWRERRDIIDAHPPTPDPENDDDDDDTVSKSSPLQGQSAVLRTRHLPMAAFSLSSTTVSALPSANHKRGPLARGATFPALPTPSQTQPQPAFNPFFDAVRQNLELSQGITERIPLRLSRRVRHRIHELPFPWLREIARRAAKLPPQNRPIIDTLSSTSEESEDDGNITSTDIEEGTEALAMQFFKIEVAEQRRLMGIMEHHAKETMVVTSDIGATPTSSFPYSITAGVEKGAKNRYRHIWPFEHARVRLHQRREADDDYVNASYVQPLGTNKRYIATQGPLPATFTDFWTLCWEQNVHVIVMLTREVENSMVKCGSYWTDTVHGPLRLRLISTTASSPPSEESDPISTRPVPQRNLTTPARMHQHRPTKHLPRRRVHINGTIRRVFELMHTGYPGAKPRRIIHLQYLEWPDMNVPDDPRGILGLVKEVDEAVHETESAGGQDSTTISTSTSNSRTPLPAWQVEIDRTTGIAKQALGKNRPVLLHCSAGVGRTGGFIAVDAVLSAIRRELRDDSGLSPGEKKDDDAMDVDEPSGLIPAPPLMSLVAPEQDGEDMSVQGTSVNTVPASTAAAGNGYQGENVDGVVAAPVPVASMPSPPITEPEASSSDREHAFPGQVPSGFALSTQTKEWAEDVSRAGEAANATISMPVLNHQHELGVAESGANALSSADLSVSSDSSSSSGNSLLDLSNANSGSSGIYRLPQSSSFETSTSGGVSSLSPARSPSMDRSPTSIKTPSSSRVQADQDLEAYSRSNLHPFGDQAILQKPSEWLGDRVRRNSPSPIPHTTPGEGSTISGKSQQNRHLQPSFALRAPPLTGVNSSDAESPSRSVSPSADEGSVASQVSSYHSRLKNHHFHPSHHKSLPTALGELHKDVHNTRPSALDLGRLTSSAPLRPTLLPPGSGPVSAIDYKEPRALHGMETPLKLGSLEEPICEIMQDMREQRMSLCQSLRQYVFVHAAIIEGALMIVDEERERVKERERQGQVEMSGLNLEPEKKSEFLWEVATDGARENGSGGGSSARQDKPKKWDVLPSDRSIDVGVTGWDFGAPQAGPARGRPDAVPMFLPTVQLQPPYPSESKTAESSEGYFGGFGSHSSGTAGLVGGMEGIAMGADSPFTPKMPGGPWFSPPIPGLQRPRHLSQDTLFNRGPGSSDFSKEGFTPLANDHSGFLLKRPSFKRKQPSGEVIDAGTTRNKRTQSENSSREREREREREKERESERMSESAPQARDSAFDTLTPGLVR